MKNKVLLVCRVILAIIFVFCSLSCDFSNAEELDDESLSGEVASTVLWRIPSRSGSLFPMAEKDGVVYYSASQILGFRAVDAVTGTVLQEDTAHGGGATIPVFFDNGKVGYLDGATLILFNADRSFDKTVTFGGADYYRSSQLVASGNSVYFSTLGHGFVTFNIDSDVRQDGERWTASLTELYPQPVDGDGDGRIYWFPPAIVDGVLYGGVYPVWTKPGTFFALKLSDRSVLWETKGQYLHAWSSWPMEYRNGKLYVLDPAGFGVIDAKTGSILVERHGEIAGGDEAGGFFYNGKVYLSNSRDPTNEEFPDNVLCVAQDTGKTVWKKSFQYSHGSNPVCYRGITYVLSQDCMRILDAETGEQLAVDTRVKGDPWQLCNVLVYKDTLIVKNAADLICVKMDFRTDGKGKLWQEK